MRVRVRFAKTGKLRFISAIDLGRVWERALRKADLPIAYSEGFSPHPKVSFGDALPLGYASLAEFAELTFGGDMDLHVICQRVNRAFPTGLEVLDARVSGDGDRRLGKLLQASLWTLDYASGDGLAAAVAALPDPGPLLVQRERKGETITTDLRPPLAGIAAHGAQIRVILRHPGFIPDHPEGGAAPRADDIHTILGLAHPPTLITRLAQGRVSPTIPGVDDALRDTTEPLVPGAEAGGAPSGAMPPDPAAAMPLPGPHIQEDAR
ncbi:MAG TPA: TIGR03936 family radical SAM-associated protein [Euzebya sp.]|nr:TIGR03936 family radical SAM-associated protein [Euzebya sp.]